VPGIAKDQLSIGIEGNIVRLSSKEGAPRTCRQPTSCPWSIDVSSSEARLENGVLTLKLAKVIPATRVAELTIN